MCLEKQKKKKIKSIKLHNNQKNRIISLPRTGKGKSNNDHTAFRVSSRPWEQPQGCHASGRRPPGTSRRRGRCRSPPAPCLRHRRPQFTITVKFRNEKRRGGEHQMKLGFHCERAESTTVNTESVDEYRQGVCLDHIISTTLIQLTKGSEHTITTLGQGVAAFDARPAKRLDKLETSSLSGFKFPLSWKREEVQHKGRCSSFVALPANLNQFDPLMSKAPGKCLDVCVGRCSPHPGVRRKPGHTVLGGGGGAGSFGRVLLQNDRPLRRVREVRGWSPGNNGPQTEKSWAISAFGGNPVFF